MSNEESEIQKKFDEFNSQRLENTAVTFALEGVSRDLKLLLNKKMMFTSKLTQYTTNLIASLSSASPAQTKKIFDKDSPAASMLDQAMTESKEISNMMNKVIYRLIEREDMLNSQLELNMIDEDDLEMLSKSIENEAKNQENPDSL